MNELLEAAKTSKLNLIALKNMAVKLQLFTVADQVRTIQEELYPDSPEEAEAKKLNLVFRMVDLSIPEDVCFLINMTLKRYWKRKGNFDVKDAAELVCERKRLFGEDGK